MDREKVISGLQRCRLMNKVNCDKCPYDYNGRGNGKSECTAELAEDALALLKEQEPQSVIFDRQCEVAPGHWERKGFCPKCHQVVLWIVNREYCGFCGQAVKWE